MDSSLRLLHPFFVSRICSHWVVTHKAMPFNDMFIEDVQLTIDFEASSVLVPYSHVTRCISLISAYLLIGTGQLAVSNIPS